MKYCAPPARVCRLAVHRLWCGVGGFEEGLEKPAHPWDECKKPWRDGLWPGEEARKTVHARWLFL